MQPPKESHHFNFSHLAHNPFSRKVQQQHPQLPPSTHMDVNLSPHAETKQGKEEEEGDADQHKHYDSERNVHGSSSLPSSLHQEEEKFMEPETHSPSKASTALISKEMIRKKGWFYGSDVASLELFVKSQPFSAKIKKDLHSRGRGEESDDESDDDLHSELSLEDSVPLSESTNRGLFSHFKDQDKHVPLSEGSSRRTGGEGKHRRDDDSDDDSDDGGEDSDGDDDDDSVTEISQALANMCCELRLSGEYQNAIMAFHS
jgi:hypothetical protein